MNRVGNSKLVIFLFILCCYNAYSVLTFSHYGFAFDELINYEYVALVVESLFEGSESQRRRFSSIIRHFYC